MKATLTGICLVVLLLMLYVTVSASLHQDLVSAARLLWPDPWFVLRWPMPTAAFSSSGSGSPGGSSPRRGESSGLC